MEFDRPVHWRDHLLDRLQHDLLAVLRIFGVEHQHPVEDLLPLLKPQSVDLQFPLQQ